MRLSLAALVLGLVLSSPAYAQFGPSAVVVAPVERRAVQLSAPLVASVEPVTQTRIATEQEMIVDERRFDEGQTVAAGDVLVVGNTDLLQAEKGAADARLVSAQAEVRRAEAECDFAVREQERVEKLYQSNNVSDKELNDARTEAAKSKASLDMQVAEVAAAQAEVDRLQQMLDKSQVKAPIDGVIASRHVEVGQWLGKGDAVADIVQLDPLYVRVSVPESVLSRVRVGDSAKVTVDALGGEEFTGTVEQIIPLADPASRTFPVKILLPNPDQRVWPGFFARATLVSSSQAEPLLVPQDAVVSTGTQHHVIAVRDGLAVLVPVTLGPTSGSQVAVSGDLREDDVVATRGNESLRGGEPLMVTNPPQDAQNQAAQPEAAQPPVQ